VPDDAPDFPPFQRTVFPVSRTPDWGSMRTPSEWNRSFSEMQESDFVRIPRYDLKAFTVPMKDLADPITDDTIPLITQKLFYSTRFFGAYDLDAGEFSAVHPGIDLKLARGTPVGAIGGGRVSTVASSQSLGLHVIIEHRLKNGETYYSVYGHFDSVSVAAGQDVTPGQTIGRVGTTGNTSGPHIHLQVDRGQPGASHVPYRPASLPSRSEAARYTVNPVVFIAEHSGGDH
jgi:murein DD-endopeptidase MepM/ murein hydrolase activator NlpD